VTGVIQNSPTSLLSASMGIVALGAMALMAGRRRRSQNRPRVPHV